MCLGETLGSGRKFVQFFGGAHGPRHKVATAIWTGVCKSHLDTIGAKSTFKGTHAGIRCVRWQILVATLAIRFQGQHIFGSISYTIDYRFFVWQKRQYDIKNCQIVETT